MPAMPRTGRPPDEGETRSERVVLRAVASQVATWREAAELQGLDLSTWVRETLDEACRSNP
jgi:uncharacterized protein (DUF1778 family)